MFKNIKNKFISIIKNISQYGRITKKNTQDILIEIKKILLESDVSLLVIKQLIKKIKISIINDNINNSLTPGKNFIKILKKQFIKIMSNSNNNINYSKQSPSIFLIVGLPGSGKTISSGKLALWISKKKKKKILITSTDIYRPAAIQQMQIISKKSKITFFTPKKYKNIFEISIQAKQYAKKNLFDILIIDTAGILDNHKKMILEIKELQKQIKPIETLFVIDAMIGQNVVNIVNFFNQHLNISGIILTKIDSDTKGGAALSASYMTKKPIKFIGTGEKIKSFKIFQPEKIISKILDIKDISSIINTMSKNVNIKNINKISHTIHKKNTFDLNDFKKYLENFNKTNKLNKIISYFINKNHEAQNSKYINKMQAIINSMTILERKTPKIIKKSRKKRISNGSGTTIQDINQLLKKFQETKKMIKQIKHHGVKNTLQYFKNIMSNIL